MDPKIAQLSNIQVCVRVRPLNKREKSKGGRCIIRMIDHSTIIVHPQTLDLPVERQHTQMFTYDHSFWSCDIDLSTPIVSQQEVYDKVGQPILNAFLDGYNSCIVAYGSTGCLAPDTPVVMHDGLIKKVQDVQVNDQLMGDDGTPRQVLELISGRGRMYDVHSHHGPSYRVNRDHVLTLQYTEPISIRWDIEKHSWVVEWHQHQRLFPVWVDSSCCSSATYEHDRQDTYQEALKFCKHQESRQVFDMTVNEYLKKRTLWKMGVVGVQRPILSLPNSSITLRQLYEDGKNWASSHHSTFLIITTTTTTTTTCTSPSRCQSPKSPSRCQSPRSPSHFQSPRSPSRCQSPRSPSRCQSPRSSIVIPTTPTNPPTIPLLLLQPLSFSLDQRIMWLSGVLDGQFQAGVCLGHHGIVCHDSHITPLFMTLMRTMGWSPIVKSSSSFTTNENEYIRDVIYFNKIVTNPYPWGTSPSLSTQYFRWDNEQCKTVKPWLRIDDVGRGDYFGFRLSHNQRFMLPCGTVTHNSGKTHTMMGGNSEESRGVIPRVCSTLFQRVNQMNSDLSSAHIYQVEISYLEIYNEAIRDLINPNNPGNLKVREHPDTGPYVADLTVIPVDDFYTIHQFMMYGNKHRVTAATKMNDRSSRSHAVFIVYLNKIDRSSLQIVTRSKLCLVDLAGSERIKDSGVTGVNQKEATNINLSLSTMGRVISSLAKASIAAAASSSTTSLASLMSPRQKQNDQQQHIPFRDSVLTWLLKDSLGGNSRTVMLAAISPTDVTYEDTLHTLKYASRAKQIVNKISVPKAQHSEMLEKTQCEVQRLKDILAQLMHPSDDIERQKIQQQLDETNQMLNSISQPWEEKSSKGLQLRSEMLNQYRKQLFIPNQPLRKLPFLVNVSPVVDFRRPIRQEVKHPSVEYDGVRFEYDANGCLWVNPLARVIWVNELEVCEPQMLTHGDKISIDDGKLVWLLKVPIV